jgi:hypothetical protein
MLRQIHDWYYVGGGWHSAIYPPARETPTHIFTDEEIDDMEWEREHPKPPAPVPRYPGDA